MIFLNKLILHKEIDEIEADNPNIVKVVTDSSDIALYFSRSKIPFIRDRADISL